MNLNSNLNVFLFGNSDIKGMLVFWTLVIGITIIVGITKSISRSIEEKRVRELDRIFNESLSIKNNIRNRLGLKLPKTTPKTFPILNFVQQRQFINAGYCEDSNSQIGKSEKILNSLLLHYFGTNKIFWNAREIGYKRPDFIFEDNAKGVYIAIEIDEPYIFKTRRPIHYFGNDEDTKKEKIYKANGWTLIRFSEFQVVNYPNECCKFLAQVVDFYQAELKYTNLPKLKECGVLPYHKHWDFAEAKQMALDGVRN